MRDLLLEERYEWDRQLNWDYGESQRIIAEMVESKTLPGFVAIEGNQCVGYVFYLSSSRRGLLGACFVHSRYQRREIESLLVSSAIRRLKEETSIERIESQFISLSEWRIRDCFFHHGFECHERVFMIRSSDMDPCPSDVDPCEIRQWNLNDLAGAARLTVKAYEKRIDRRITFHYQREPECRKFLEDLILRPGCGIFVPEASFSAIERSSQKLLGYVLTSRVSPSDGHIPQIAVAVEEQGKGIGSALLKKAITALSLVRCRRTSLTVSEENVSAITLYEKLGFTRKIRFPTFVWENSESTAIVDGPRSPVEKSD